MDGSRSSVISSCITAKQFTHEDRSRIRFSTRTFVRSADVERFVGENADDPADAGHSRVDVRAACLVLLGCMLTALTGPSAFSQYIPSGSYSTRDGLPSNTIISLYQDSGGYLWIGTNNGLSRYDGAQFTNFSTVQGLSNNWITDIAEDPREPGTLWIGTIAGGVNRIREGRVSVFRPGADDASNNISSLVVDTSGTVWATTFFGLFMIRDGRICKG